MKSLLLAFGFALISFSVAFAAEPKTDDSVQTLIDDANSKLKAGKTRAACRAFEKAVEISEGRSYEAQLGLASARLKAKDPAGAVAPALAAEKLGTNDPMWSAAAFLAGLALYQSQPTDAAALAQAAASLERSIQLAPDQATPARVTLGFVYKSLRQPEKAAAQLREALARLAPSSPMRREARIGLCTLRAEHPELAPSSADSPIDKDQLKNVKMPVKLHAPNPQYTKEAREAGVQGVFVALATIDREGCIVNLKTLKGLGAGMEQMAIQTMRQWVFEPATLKGEPRDVFYRLAISFTSESASSISSETPDPPP